MGTKAQSSLGEILLWGQGVWFRTKCGKLTMNYSLFVLVICLMKCTLPEEIKLQTVISSVLYHKLAFSFIKGMDLVK